MKIDFTVKFSKTLCTTYKIVDGKPKVEKKSIPPYVACVTDNILDEERYDITRESKYIPDEIFRRLTLDEDMKY